MLRLEVPDVLPERLRQLLLVLADLGVLALESLDVELVEHRRHRGDALQEVLDRLDVLVLLEHAAVEAGLIRVVRHGIPGAEHQVVQVGQRHELLDQRRASLRPLAEPDGPHLGQGADRLGLAAADQFDTGDEGGGHRAQPDTQHTELALGRRNRPGSTICH